MTSTKKVGDYNYLIVGGTTKAATTSLFTYLADHPAICPASYKETRFFLNKDYPLPSKYRFNGDVEEYNQLYLECSDSQIRLESTPDYIYCQSARERIESYLPNAKLIFSLRDPISRLISWYRFAKQINKLPQSLCFDEYVQQLFKVEGLKMRSENDFQKEINPEENVVQEQFMQTLQQGCYAAYIEPYLKCFSSNRIHIIFYESLSEQPLNVIKEICCFANINHNVYENYTFKVTNPTQAMRSSTFHQKYRTFRFQLRRRTHNIPVIHNTLRNLRHAIEPLYLRLNTRTNQKVVVSPKTQTRLVEYYKQDVQKLKKLIGKEPPWKAFV